VRFRTGRPVSTTERLRRYVDDRRLLRLGDWVFPDCHVSLRADASIGEGQLRSGAASDAAKTCEAAVQIAGLDAGGRRPVLLKMIAYPSAGIEKASLVEQNRFFKLLLEQKRETMSAWPSDVYVSFHSAFDMPWKVGWPFYEWDPHTGLFNEDGTPRLAVEVITTRR